MVSVALALTGLSAAACTTGTEQRTSTHPVGAVSVVAIPGTVSGFPARPARLYLPPGYNPGSAVRPPVLIMLAGIPGGTGDWFELGGLQQEIEGFADRHGGRAPIVVAPDDAGADQDDLLCMDSPLGKVDTYLSQDVPRWITDHLAVDPSPRAWAIGGLSYGGTCALQLAVRHPAVFPTFLDFSGETRPTRGTRADTVNDVFAGDAAAYDRQDPAAILTTTSFPDSAGVIATGDDDPPYTGEQRAVFQACRDAGMQVRWLDLPGGHDWEVWREVFRRSLPWLAQRLNLNRPPG